MAGGVIVVSGGRDYHGDITAFVVVACLVAAMGGLIFGYDIGISGGVTSMEDFIKRFFPSVLRKMSDEMGKENEYCKFDSQLLQLFTSSLHLAALIASFFASIVTRSYGRKISMLSGGLVFFAGAVLNGAATNIEMLIVGRLLLGVGVGFTNQSVPLYLSEMAPAKIRGALNIGFQMAITIGILISNFVNYGTVQIKGGWGWRVSLGLAAVPAAMFIVGSLILPETPNSILERGNPERRRKYLVDACEVAKQGDNPWKKIMMPKYRPQLVICTLVPFFQQLTGINAIIFYAPVLFNTLGFGEDASLVSTDITGAVNVLATIVSIVSVDRFGRRILFLEGGFQMIICQVAVAIMIGLNFGFSGEGLLTKVEANLLLVFICGYVAAYAWSWGPLGWLVPSEICPLEIRSAGQAISVSVNMFFTFIIGQLFLTMLCHLKFGLFLLFAGFVIIMTMFIHFFLPEMKNIPIEEMNRVWKAHWFWKRYVTDEDVISTDQDSASSSHANDII
ncbi:hypothetical protein UlMin_044334 [Ulmus minor]